LFLYNRKNRSTSILKLSSTKIFDDLARFNIVPRKTMIYSLPEWIISHPLLHHFLRGYSDGDGSFYIVKGKCDLDYLGWNIIGTKEFIIDIINILKEPKCIPNIVEELCSISIKKFGNKATLDNIRDIRASVYSLYFTEEENNG
jgi:hypothetical protein